MTAETTDDDATAVIMINGVEDADGTGDLVPGYNVIAVEVTAEDGTTTRTYTVTVLRAQPDDDDDSTGETITSLLSRLDAELTETAVGTYQTQLAGYLSEDNLEDGNPQGSLSPAGFNYPAGFGPWYTVKAVIVNQEGQPNNIDPVGLFIDVRGVVTSVASSGTHRAHVLPSGADIELYLEGDNWTRSYSLKNPDRRRVSKCIDEGETTGRHCRAGETATEQYKWSDDLPPTLTDGEKVIVRLRYSAPRPGKPGRPLVTAPEGKSGALVVKWTAPANDDPKVRGYEVHVSPAQAR